MVLVCANHITIEASEESTDLYVSMDQVADKIARQMRKYKTRLLRQHRPHRNQSVRYFDEQVYQSDAFDNLEEMAANGYNDRGSAAAPSASSNGSAAAPAAPVEPDVIQTEKYPVKPMYVDEAVLQMQMSERQFVVFLNAKTDKVNVLYRRKKGDYGLIQPTFA